MSRHLSRSGAPAPSRTVAPFHRGPAAIATAPASPTSAPPVHAPNAALLIDFDNVTMGIRSDLQEELKNLLSSDIIKGKVAVRRAYADWRRYPQYIVPLTESSIDLIFAPAYGSAKKNATDIRLAIDALELVFTRPEIGTFVLLSGDSDFSSMVIKLKEYGKYVIGVGIRESSSDLLVMNCDEYYSYNALAGLVKTGDDETTRWDPWELVTEAVTRMKRNGDVMRSDRLKQVMQEIDASFDEKNLGMPKFSRFVQEASHRGLLSVTKLESGQLEIDVPAGGVVVATSATSPVADAADVEPRRDSSERSERGERDRDDRRGRRGRRGRGRDRDRDRDGGARDGATADTGDRALSLTDELPLPMSETAEFMTPPVQPMAATSGATASATSSVVAAPSAVPAFGVQVADSIGTSGERLTRSEAFDLVRRAVESLVSGDDTTSASAARQRAFELLGRNSESLSARNFERILQDSHDANMIDLRRRGHDFELGRAADAASIVEQLKSVDDAHKAAAAALAASQPPAPRGMGARGIGGRGKAAGPPPALLMVGVVAPSGGSAPLPTVVATPAAAEAATSSTADATSSSDAVADAPSKGAGRAAKTAKAAGKPAAKAPAKAAAKSAAKKAAKPAAKAPAKAPAKVAKKAAAKTPKR